MWRTSPGDRIERGPGPPVGGRQTLPVSQVTILPSPDGCRAHPPSSSRSLPRTVSLSPTAPNTPPLLSLSRLFASTCSHTAPHHSINYPTPPEDRQLRQDREFASLTAESSALKTGPGMKLILNKYLWTEKEERRGGGRGEEEEEGRRKNN